MMRHFDVMIANAPYLSASVKHNFLRAATAMDSSYRMISPKTYV